MEYRELKGKCSLVVRETREGHNVLESNSFTAESGYKRSFAVLCIHQTVPLPHTLISQWNSRGSDIALVFVRLPTSQGANEKSWADATVLNPTICTKAWRWVGNVTLRKPWVMCGVTYRRDTTCLNWMKANLSLWQAVEAHRVVRRRGPHNFYTDGSEVASLTRRPLLPLEDSWYGWVNLRAVVRLEGRKHSASINCA
jgi:hypothetical protein